MGKYLKSDFIVGRSGMYVFTSWKFNVLHLLTTRNNGRHSQFFGITSSLIGASEVQGVLGIEHFSKGFPMGP